MSDKVKVSLEFKGNNAEEAAEAFMIWFVDGGGEDVVCQNLEYSDLTIEDMKFDMDKKILTLITD